jgi:hypothetical protein
MEPPQHIAPKPRVAAPSSSAAQPQKTIEVAGAWVARASAARANSRIAKLFINRNRFLRVPQEVTEMRLRARSNNQSDEKLRHGQAGDHHQHADHFAEDRTRQGSQGAFEHRSRRRESALICCRHEYCANSRWRLRFHAPAWTQNRESKFIAITRFRVLYIWLHINGL